MLPTTRLLQTSVRTYKARRPWPPDFRLLSEKEQFRLERRYRRRAKLKWARPRLQKAVSIAQWSIMSYVVVYGVLWADWGREDHMFMPIRNWVKEKKESFWSVPARPSTAAELGKARDAAAIPASDGRKQ
ncbi:hypothetical protein FN846DRAFT_771309 [Sphaerosporella brunnea]|uniref:Uncharacterized protein n=1 Tax=Sphaerosporella brunnea TaxID=1250544 RepID=A0A5J5FAV4_9PEZI|nr:hypothetical protein FN846DRAFT_771309 [Sphaerosporella brunnea]